MEKLSENENLRLAVIILSNFIRYFLFAGIAYFVFYVWKRKAWYYRKIQQKFPENKEIIREISYSLSTIFIFALYGAGIWYAEKKGYTMMYEKVGEYGWFYWIFSLVLLIFIHETWFYWTHRWMHSSPKVFKVVHRVHHLSHNPTPWAALAFHPIEGVIDALFLPIAIFIFPFHVGAIALFLVCMIILNVLAHTGFEYNIKGFVSHPILKWINTPTHHNMHHNYSEGNYGLYLNFWDRIMGTNHAQYEEEYDKILDRKEAGETESQ